MSLGASVKFGVNCGLLRGKFASGQSKGRWTTKMAAKSGEYKGKGAPPAGRHTRKGGYIIEPWRTPEIVVPDLTNFALKPYVLHTTPKVVTKTAAPAAAAPPEAPSS